MRQTRRSTAPSPLAIATSHKLRKDSGRAPLQNGEDFQKILQQVENAAQAGKNRGEILACRLWTGDGAQRLARSARLNRRARLFIGDGNRRHGFGIFPHGWYVQHVAAILVAADARP